MADDCICGRHTDGRLPLDKWIATLSDKDKLRIVSRWLNENLIGRNLDAQGTVLCDGYWLDNADIAKVVMP